MTKQDESNILHAAIKAYGAKAQTDMMIEEMAELTQALLKLRRYPEDQKNREHIIEEMADVSIVLSQMEIIYGDYRLERFDKLERLIRRVEQHRDDKADREKAIEESGETGTLALKFNKYVQSLDLKNPGRRCENCVYRDDASGRCLNPESRQYTGKVASEGVCSKYEG